MQRAAGFTLVGMFTECMSQAGIHMCVTADNVGVQTNANLKQAGNGNLRDRELFRPGGLIFSRVLSCLSLLRSLFLR